MSPETIKAAEEEARRFLKRVHAWRQAQSTYSTHHGTYPVATPRECGAVRRASMDLTRALAAMRKP